MQQWGNENLGSNRVLFNVPRHKLISMNRGVALSASGIQHDTLSGTHQQGNRWAHPTDDELEHMTEESKADFKASKKQPNVML